MKRERGEDACAGQEAGREAIPRGWKWLALQSPGPREPTRVTCCPKYTALEEMTTPGSPALHAGSCGLGTVERAIAKGLAGCGAHQRGVERPAQMALAALRMLRSGQSLPAQYSIPGRNCCLGKKPLRDSGQGVLF